MLSCDNDFVIFNFYDLSPTHLRDFSCVMPVASKVVRILKIYYMGFFAQGLLFQQLLSKYQFSLLCFAGPLL